MLSKLPSNFCRLWLFLIWRMHWAQLHINCMLFDMLRVQRDEPSGWHCTRVSSISLFLRWWTWLVTMFKEGQTITSFDSTYVLYSHWNFKSKWKSSLKFYSSSTSVKTYADDAILLSNFLEVDVSVHTAASWLERCRTGFIL